MPAANQAVRDADKLEMRIFGTGNNHGLRNALRVLRDISNNITAVGDAMTELEAHRLWIRIMDGPQGVNFCKRNIQGLLVDWVDAFPAERKAALQVAYGVKNGQPAKDEAFSAYDAMKSAMTELNALSEVTDYSTFRTQIAALPAVLDGIPGYVEEGDGPYDI